MAITRKIGERFTLGGDTYEVRMCAKWYSCQGCAFQDRSHPSRRCYENDCAMLEDTGECNGRVRDDRTYVYFAKVKP